MSVVLAAWGSQVESILVDFHHPIWDLIYVCDLSGKRVPLSSCRPRKGTCWPRLTLTATRIKDGKPVRPSEVRANW